jgi:UPF0716 protein FxsA
MPFIVLFLFISLPVMEVASIVQVSHWIGAVPTFLLLAAGATFGVYLIRSQSLLLGSRMLEAMREGVPPQKPMLDGGMIIFAGILFMVPGFVTDFLALLLLIPAARRQFFRVMSFGFRNSGQTWRRRPQPRSKPQAPPHADDVIDAEFTEVPPERRERDQAGGAASGGSPWRRR